MRKVRLFIALLLVLLLTMWQISAIASTTATVISGIPRVDANTASTHKYSSYWQYWSQGASGYPNGGTSGLRNMRAYGCRVVAQSKLLVEAGLASSNVSTFNPDIYFAWTAQNGYQNYSPYENYPIGGGVIAWGKSKGTTISMRSEAYTGPDQVMTHIRAGKYVIMSCGAHQAYIGRAASLSFGEPIVLDSGSWTSCNPALTKYLRGYSDTTFDTIYIYTVGPLPGTLDVNGSMDGQTSGTLGDWGTFDMYINGTKVASGVNDFNSSYTAATNFEIKNIRANDGFDFLGIQSGSESGKVTPGSDVKLVLKFARQGNLVVNGQLDGILDSSIADYGTFDVYVNGVLDAAGCTSYSKHLPNNTRYEVCNIQTKSGKNYDGLSSFSGTIQSGSEASVILPYTTDGIATPEWQVGRVVPGNLDRELLEVEYRFNYTVKDRTSPGSDWEMIEEGAIQYENDGAQYMSDNEQATSATRTLVGYYYFHYCNNGANANYYKKDYLPIKHTISMASAKNDFSVKEMGTDGDGSGRKYYYLTHTTGEYAGGIAQCGESGSRVYYRGYVYQNKKAYRINTYTKTGEWTSLYDTTATSSSVRWRLKEGAADYKGLQLNFVVDGESVSSLDGVAALNVYINGEQKAANATSYRGYFPGDFTYDIQLSQLAEYKLYTGIVGGELVGAVDVPMKTLTLYFETGVQTSEIWKEIPSELLEYLDDNTELEYRNTYTQTGRTSPGEEWTLLQQGAVQYENSGAQYMSDNELTTSDTRVLVGYYYFHYCNNGITANYYKKDYLPIKHTISMASAKTDFTVKEMGTDGDGSGRKYYNLTHTNGEYAGGIAQCGDTGSNVYYRGCVYQDKKAYRINTYSMTGEWTNELDSAASSVEYRVRLKQYDVTFAPNGGSFAIEKMTKVSGTDLVLPTDVPVRNMYEFIGWNTMADGSGVTYQPGAAYAENESVSLYAQWKELGVVSLPDDLTVIEAQAFTGSAAAVVYIHDGCTTIGSKAFANCPNLYRIYVPETAETIALDAFDGCPNLVIYAPAGSIAIRVAKYNDIPFIEE